MQNNKLCILMSQVKGIDKNCQLDNILLPTVTWLHVHVITEKVCFISHPFTHEAFEWAGQRLLGLLE